MLIVSSGMAGKSLVAGATDGDEGSSAAGSGEWNSSGECLSRPPVLRGLSVSSNLMERRAGDVVVRLGDQEVGRAMTH